MCCSLGLTLGVYVCVAVCAAVCATVCAAVWCSVLKGAVASLFLSARVGRSNSRAALGSVVRVAV